MRHLIFIAAMSLSLPLVAKGLEGSPAPGVVDATSDDDSALDKDLQRKPDDNGKNKDKGLHKGELLHKAQGKNKKKDADTDTDGDKAAKDNFGAAVSAEAHKMKADGTKGRDFGKWVSNQRRKNQDQAKNGADDTGGSRDNEGAGKGVPPANPGQSAGHGPGYNGQNNPGQSHRGH